MVSSTFRRNAPKRDLSAIINRYPVGLNGAVQATLTDIVSPVLFVGVIGYQFTQYNLRYTVMMMDDNGNEDYKFTVTAPSAQPYYHRNTEMGIAEKAHALMVVMKSANCERMIEHGTHFSRLETACFKHSSEKEVLRGPTGARQMPNGNRVVAHVGLSYPDNQNWQDQPTIGLLAMEWIDGLSRCLIDCSDWPPKFIISDATDPKANRYFMKRGHAQKAVDYLKQYTKRQDPELATLIASQNLWPALEREAEWSSLISAPAP